MGFSLEKLPLLKVEIPSKTEDFRLKRRGGLLSTTSHAATRCVERGAECLAGKKDVWDLAWSHRRSYTV